MDIRYNRNWESKDSFYNGKWTGVRKVNNFGGNAAWKDTSSELEDQFWKTWWPTLSFPKMTDYKCNIYQLNG